MSVKTDSVFVVNYLTCLPAVRQLLNTLIGEAGSVQFQDHKDGAPKDCDHFSTARGNLSGGDDHGGVDHGFKSG